MTQRTKQLQVFKAAGWHLSKRHVILSLTIDFFSFSKNKQEMKFMFTTAKRKSFTFRCIISIVNICFIASFASPMRALAQSPADLGLPVPGTMVNLSNAFVPVIIKGLRVHPENPVLFDFIVDTGNSNMSIEEAQFKKESEKLIKYFLASLTIPEDNLWVNLSPYEKDRIISKDLGQTEMGRDMLAQDYILKQITASLIYPEKDLGKAFWNKVYQKSQELYGTSDVPVNTFNKVWILPDKAGVYVRNNTAFVVESHLKVMLEEDYLAMQKHNGINTAKASAAGNNAHSVGSSVVRDVVLPELEKEVNSGKNFGTLRQMVNSLILASWYKNNLKEALLTQVYANKAKINGISLEDKTIQNQIYQEYLKAYKKGVFNYIKEDIDQTTIQPMPRKYFSGGLGFSEQHSATRHPAMYFTLPQGAVDPAGSLALVTSLAQAPASRAMMGDQYLGALRYSLDTANTPRALRDVLGRINKFLDEVKPSIAVEALRTEAEKKLAIDAAIKELSVNVALAISPDSATIKRYAAQIEKLLPQCWADGHRDELKRLQNLLTVKTAPRGLAAASQAMVSPEEMKEVADQIETNIHQNPNPVNGGITFWDTKKNSSNIQQEVAWKIAQQLCIVETAKNGSIKFQPKMIGDKIVLDFSGGNLSERGFEHLILNLSATLVTLRGEENDFSSFMTLMPGQTAKVWVYVDSPSGMVLKVYEASFGEESGYTFSNTGFWKGERKMTDIVRDRRYMPIARVVPGSEGLSYIVENIGGSPLEMSLTLASKAMTTLALEPVQTMAISFAESFKTGLDDRTKGVFDALIADITKAKTVSEIVLTLKAFQKRLTEGDLKTIARAQDKADWLDAMLQQINLMSQPETPEVAQKKPPVKAISSALTKVVGRLFKSRPQFSFMDAKKPHEPMSDEKYQNLVKARNSKMVENAPKVLALAKNKEIQVGVDGALRLVDANLGTSLDLPQSQMQFMDWQKKNLNIDPRGFGEITSTGFLPAKLRQFFAVSPASDPEAIEYVSPRGSFSIKEGDIPNFRDTKDKRFFQGKMKTADGKEIEITRFVASVYHIFHDIFGLKGVRIDMQKLSLIAEMGGLESSNGFIVAVVGLGSILSGANLTESEIVNLAIKLENYEAEGLTGGQGHYAFLLGLPSELIWLSNMNDGQYDALAVPLMSKEAQREFAKKTMMFQAGVTYKGGKKMNERTAGEINRFWMFLAELGHPKAMNLHVEKIWLKKKSIEAIVRGDMEAFCKYLDRWVDIRNQLVRIGLEEATKGYDAYNANSQTFDNEFKKASPFAHELAKRVFLNDDAPTQFPEVHRFMVQGKIVPKGSYFNGQVLTQDKQVTGLEYLKNPNAYLYVSDVAWPIVQRLRTFGLHTMGLGAGGDGANMLLAVSPEIYLANRRIIKETKKEEGKPDQKIERPETEKEYAARILRDEFGILELDNPQKIEDIMHGEGGLIQFWTGVEPGEVGPAKWRGLSDLNEAIKNDPELKKIEGGLTYEAPQSPKEQTYDIKDLVPGSRGLDTALGSKTFLVLGGDQIKTGSKIAEDIRSRAIAGTGIVIMTNDKPATERAVAEIFKNDPENLQSYFKESIETVAVGTDGNAGAAFNAFWEKSKQEGKLLKWLGPTPKAEDVLVAAGSRYKGLSQAVSDKMGRAISIAPSGENALEEILLGQASVGNQAMLGAFAFLKSIQKAFGKFNQNFLSPEQIRLDHLVQNYGNSPDYMNLAHNVLENEKVTRVAFEGFNDTDSHGTQMVVYYSNGTVDDRIQLPKKTDQGGLVVAQVIPYGPKNEQGIRPVHVLRLTATGVSDRLITRLLENRQYFVDGGYIGDLSVKNAVDRVNAIGGRLVGFLKEHPTATPQDIAQEVQRLRSPVVEGVSNGAAVEAHHGTPAHAAGGASHAMVSVSVVGDHGTSKNRVPDFVQNNAYFVREGKKLKPGDDYLSIIQRSLTAPNPIKVPLQRASVIGLNGTDPTKMIIHYQDGSRSEVYNLPPLTSRVNPNRSNGSEQWLAVEVIPYGKGQIFELPLTLSESKYLIAGKPLDTFNKEEALSMLDSLGAIMAEYLSKDPNRETAVSDNEIWAALAKSRSQAMISGTTIEYKNAGVPASFIIRLGQAQNNGVYSIDLNPLTGVTSLTKAKEIYNPVVKDLTSFLLGLRGHIASGEIDNKVSTLVAKYLSASTKGPVKMAKDKSAQKARLLLAASKNARLSPQQFSVTHKPRRVINPLRAAADREALSAPVLRRGGIDLNTRNTKTEVSGEKINLRFDPAMVAQFRRGDFSGVEVLIVSIVRLNSVMPLFERN